jgi:hypothetical protein
MSPARLTAVLITGIMRQCGSYIADLFLVKGLRPSWHQYQHQANSFMPRASTTPVFVNMNLISALP